MAQIYESNYDENDNRGVFILIMKVALLKNEQDGSVDKWQIACDKRSVNYDIIDLTKSDWLDKIKRKKYDLCLLRPSGTVSHYKQMYDERVYSIVYYLGLSVFPSLKEIMIYENKRMLSYFLESQDIPHPKTYVFYNKQEAEEFIEKVEYPIVGKTAIGASGSGVKIIREKKDTFEYISQAFSKKGIKSRFGPNRNTGSPSSWTKKAIQEPSYLIKKIKEYLYRYSRGQTDFLIFQEYIPHEYEWRIVKIGESYFGHQKIKTGEMASGTKGIDFVKPPSSILNFTKDLCAKHNFNSMAFDLFEDGKGGYLVNELQTIFGHVQDYILEVDGKPGRYIFKDEKWVFEEGMFNINESYDLRLQTALELVKQNRIDERSDK